MFNRIQEIIGREAIGERRPRHTRRTITRVHKLTCNGPGTKEVGKLDHGSRAIDIVRTQAQIIAGDFVLEEYIAVSSRE